MSQLVLDDQLDVVEILPPLLKWITATRLQVLRPRQLILDDRVPEVLRSLKRPTFVTIDHGFWKRALCHPEYCILYFALAKDQQDRLPDLLRRAFHCAEFRTRKLRMGKVARVISERVDYYDWGQKGRFRVSLPTNVYYR